MNAEERKIFWQSLCSVDGNNPDDDTNKLQSSIIYPKFLYRYRSVSEFSIDALKNNKLYFSSADYYDDPFDTLIKINYNVVEKEIHEALSTDNIKKAIDIIKEEFGDNSEEWFLINSIFNNVDLEKSLVNVKEYLKNDIRLLLQKQSWSTCFSESGINETLWLKYANNYKGFCLVYDMENDAKRLCGKKEKCNTCVVNKQGVYLYPMYYSDEGYDATEYISYLALSVIIKKIFPSKQAEEFISKLPKMLWQRERIALVKSKCHEYDKEWRMILNTNAIGGKYCQEWIPYGVILGLRTSKEDIDKIIESAKIAGIEYFFETYINDENRLDIRCF